ncbi:MAG TPA: hypothetical protein VGN09_24590 [Vicinamibacteria bacterium]|jgi:hypothetical protein
MKLFRVGLGLLCLVSLPLSVQAQNNTAATASTYMMNQGWINVNMGAAPNTQRWYAYGVVAGRSYCAEGIAEKTPTATGVGSYDGETSVFRADGTTLIGRVDDSVAEPGNSGTGAPGNGVPFNPGRVCYIAPATETNFIRVGNLNFGATVRSYQWRVIETTQFCPWFFSGSGFEAFILIKNTTNRDVRATVTLRDAAGTVLGTQAGTAPANGSFNLQVSAAPPTGFGLTAASGSVEIVYGPTVAPGPSFTNLLSVGAPGSLIANVTTLSFVSGVSFDTPAAPRQDWTR